MWESLWLFLLRWGLDRFVRYAVSEANRRAAAYFTWDLSRKWRRFLKLELVAAIQRAKARTPDFTADEDLLRCCAYTLESDELAACYNNDKPASQRIDVHAVGGMAVPHGRIVE